MTPAQQILQRCTVSGSLVILPEQMERKLYQEVADILQKIGGKWSRKHAAFLFPNDPTELLAEVASGVKRNLKKEFQFFETPPELAKEIAREAWIEPGEKVLEPSAGNGALIKAAHQFYEFPIWFDVCEIQKNCQKELEKITGTKLVAEDFLKIPDQYKNFYDCIIHRSQLKIEYLYSCL